jgi:uncharacterized protein (DUF2147 family)
MRRLMLAAASLVLTAGPALAADPAEGVWLTQAKDAKVRIAPCPGQASQLCGEVVWLQTPKTPEGQPKHDEHNPDPKLRSRPIIGLTMIRDFHAAGPGRWEGGKIYDPHSGKTYNSKMRIGSDGALKVDGCVMMFCQTQTWTRAGS